ncbi:MAG: hypothetical protein ABS83_02420 [Rhodospirillales bacterium SCN 65-16]|nr:MAG: hypothetical protein ABS83_02420 [Rhodospirillales bacterium SCN 65-16]
MKLRFSEVLTESFGFFFANIRLFFHIVTIPWILSLVIRLIGSQMPRESLIPVLAEKLIDVVPMVMFMVAWQRVVLLGPHRLDRLPGLGWSARETAFLVHLVKIAGVTFLLLCAFILTMGEIDPAAFTAGVPPDPETAAKQTLLAPLASAFIVSALIALRVSFGLAATSVDEPGSPVQSWTLSRGNGWVIVGSLFLISFAGTMVTAASVLLLLGFMRGVLGADFASYVVTWTFALLVSYAGNGVLATAQAIIFRRLTGWREGASLPSTVSQRG